MVERTQLRLKEARDLLQQNRQGMPPDARRGLVTAIADAVVCQDSAGDSLVADTVELLARDPDWAVRLEVAKISHLFDDEVCGRLVTIFRGDCNSYVRSHAERSLARQRKARQTSSRKHGECQTYSDQLAQLARQYGGRAAAKVQELADQRYAMFAAAVAHDVRSILTTLSANAAAMAGELGKSGRMGSILEDIGFLKRTIESMEQFSRPLPLQRHAEDLGQIIHQAIEKAREGVAQQGHDHAAVDIVVTAATAIQLRVSRRLLVLALTNVIENAFEAFAQREADALRPGRIEVQVVVDGYETRIIVRDNGPGIEPPVLKELATFAPTGPNKSKRSSSGWGLSLVHRYVAAHGGAVTIDSEIDQGTAVVITLPMRDLAEEDEE